MVDIVQSFFRTKYLLKELNSTFIVLIPKQKGANSFGDSRPISLCNLVYKIISKIIITNQMRNVMTKLIFPI